jgi:hypothetical protein
MKVFISYPSKDGLKYAKTLHSILSKRGHDPYLIDHEICVGETIWDEIANEILTRKLSIFVITRSSQESEGQKQEYDLAVARYKKRLAFAEENSWKIVEARFPFLTPPKGLIFNDKDFEQKCESISTQLVKTQNKEEEIQETTINFQQKSFEKLDDRGLDKSEVAKCLENLSSSYQNQSVIPEAFAVKVVEKTNNDFVNVGFNYRLPREWFLTYDETKTAYSNEFLFQEFGREIALGERDYLVTSIMKTSKIHISEESDNPEDLLEQIKEAMSTLNKLGHKPKILFPSIPHYLTMHQFKEEAYLKYSNVTPQPVLRASLNIDGVELKLIEPLGRIPKETILFGDDAIIWHVKRYKDSGALYIDLGNDILYHQKYVDTVALTTIRCEINPEGVFILKRKDSA